MIGINGVVAVIGTFVSVQAFRGYRRNDQVSLAYLSIGLLAITVGPFGSSELLHYFTNLSEAGILLIGLQFELVGLFAIYYSLVR